MIDQMSLSAPTPESAFHVRKRVVTALILRDIRTRFFGNGLGYLVAIAWPLSHMALLLIAYQLLGRTAPMGSSMMLFFALGLVPTIVFQYMSRFIMFSCLVNKPLLYFPVVTIFDIICARSILECCCGVLVAFILAFVLLLFDIEISPHDHVQAAAAFVASLFLGFGVGAANGIIVLRFPPWNIVYLLTNIVLWASAGVVFLPATLPEQVQHLISWNPLLHGVEWMRQSYYPDYKSPLLSKEYMLSFATVSLFFGLVVQRYMRRFLLQQ